MGLFKRIKVDGKKDRGGLNRGLMGMVKMIKVDGKEDRGG